MNGSQRVSGWLKRLEALALSAGVLWAAAVTDFWSGDSLSPAAALAIGESPLLLAARPAVAELWSRRQADETLPPSEEDETIPQPVEETPLDTDSSTDNGVPAKTLIPTDPTGYTVCGRVYISNSTDHVLSIPELQEPFSAVLTGEGPQVLILHTHGSESYTPAAGTEVVWSGDHRTTDNRYNVVRVGDEIARVLGEEGISVLHDRTLYDYPSYSEAYDRSLAAIESYLAQYPSIQFILDVHRDAIADAQGNQYKVISQLEEGTSAQMTLVVGSDGSGLPHPNWMENLRLAVAIQEELLRDHPTLMRPMLLRNSRYNQHTAPGALLLEVGAAGNDPKEALLAGQVFARGMAEILQSRSK